MAVKNRDMLPGQTQPDFVDKLSDRIEANAQNAPSSGSVLWAAWRQGLKDLQNAVLNPWNGFSATHEEPGNIATIGPAEAHEEKFPEASGNTLESAVKGSAVPQPSAPLRATDVGEIGPPLATPMVKGQAVKQQPIDPLDQAREAARETSKGQGKSRQIEVGD